MKKFFKIAGITLLIIIVLLIALPFVFQSQIKGVVKNFINENLNANVEFSSEVFRRHTLKWAIW